MFKRQKIHNFRICRPCIVSSYKHNGGILLCVCSLITAATIEELVTSGNIDSLSVKYDNVIDLECSMEGNSGDFMDGACRFVCAFLNA